MQRMCFTYLLIILTITYDFKRSTYFSIDIYQVVVYGILLKAYGIQNDSCITYLYAVRSRQLGGERCCSSDISRGFLKEVSTCRIEALRDISVQGVLGLLLNRNADRPDGIVDGSS